MTLSAEPAPLRNEEGLRRKLVPRQIAMMAMGSAIGVGLFLGSTVTIRLAGPGVIVTYVFGALIALVMGYALAEMAVVHPVAGSFGVFADRYLSRWAGFVVRATYAFVQILAIGAEVTAVAIYFTFWFPGVPPWVWVVGMAAVLDRDQHRTGRPVRRARILVRLDQGDGDPGVHRRRPGVDHRASARRRRPDFVTWSTARAGFLPNGWRGVWLALTLVITSYMGIEGIAVTAGEAEHPETSIPRAMRTMVLRLILFYVLAIAVMLMMSPWHELAEGGGGLTGSPFVRGFAAIGIPFAAGAMNLVVISAAVSSANSNLYMTSRMLLSLARSGYAPRGLAVVSHSRRAAPRRRDRQRRSRRGDPAGGLRAVECVPRALWHRGGRHALHLDRHPVHLSALQEGAHAGPARAAADQDARPSRRRVVRRSSR